MIQPSVLAHPVAPSGYPIARHTSATGAWYADANLTDLQRRYLVQVGVFPLTDHEASSALGCQVSSICSTRAAVARYVIPTGDVQRVEWARGGKVRHTERAIWRLRTAEEIRQYDEETFHAALPRGGMSG